MQTRWADSKIWDHGLATNEGKLSGLSKINSYHKPTMSPTTFLSSDESISICFLSTSFPNVRVFMCNSKLISFLLVFSTLHFFKDIVSNDLTDARVENSSFQVYISSPRLFE